MNKNTTYQAEGLVYGNLWGGGKGAYPSEKLEGTSLKDIATKVKEGIENGSLDSGMGCESLTGAVMNIAKITTVMIGGKPYVNKEYHTEIYGNLSGEEEEFLYEKVMYL